MRAVISAFCVAGLLACVASANPLSREKRFAGVYTAAGASPFGSFAGSPFTGVFAGNPFFGGFGRPATNRGSMFPFNYMPIVIPFPTIEFPEIKNWYEGPNVCKEEKIMNSQLPEDVIPDDWKEGMPNVNTDFRQEHESCKGTNTKYVCVKRNMGKNGEAQVIATKYECCHGFVRDPTGAPGCVESKQQNTAGATKESNTKLTQSDPTYYMYLGNKMQGSASASSSSSGNLDKVPLQ